MHTAFVVVSGGSTQTFLQSGAPSCGSLGSGLSDFSSCWEGATPPAALPSHCWLPFAAPTVCRDALVTPLLAAHLPPPAPSLHRPAAVISGLASGSMAEPALDFQRLRALLPQVAGAKGWRSACMPACSIRRHLLISQRACRWRCVADGLDAPLPPGPREEAWSGACRELGELSLSFRTADFQAVDWAGCAALMR